MIGFVAIGRNEGERLERCFAALVSNYPDMPIVYVDSGSTDASVDAARKAGATVVNLDLSVPFTAARARNEGVQCMLAQYTDVEFVQFLDGDCEIQPGWIEAALDTLKSRGVAIVCGRRREKFPESSVYNRLIDIEWDTPIGEADACGGDALVRVKAFQQVAGYNAGIIAGEEPEMCLRMRRLGWRVVRIDHEMALHDAALTSWKQWWKRAVRGGHAYAEGAWRYGLGPERYNMKNVVSIAAWAAGFPLVFIVLGCALCLAVPVWIGISTAVILLVSLYALQFTRLLSKGRKHGTGIAFPWATATMLGKFAEFSGVVIFLRRIVCGGNRQIIEYKAKLGPVSTKARHD